MCELEKGPFVVAFARRLLWSLELSAKGNYQQRLDFSYRVYCEAFMVD